MTMPEIVSIGSFLLNTVVVVFAVMRSGIKLEHRITLLEAKLDGFNTILSDHIKQKRHQA